MRKLMILYIIILLVACKKDEPPTEKTYRFPVIKPLSYLPVYPGSYWIYENYKGDTITKKTSDDYVAIGTHGFLESDSVMVPVYNGQAIYEYNVASYAGPLWYFSHEWLHGILRDDEAGKIFYWYRFPRGDNLTKKVEARDTSVTVNAVTYDSVIVILHYSVGGGLYGNEPYREIRRQYFAKGVGMILEEYGNHQLSLKLISYHIER